MLRRFDQPIARALLAAAIACCLAIAASPVHAQCTAPTTLPDVDGLTTYARCLAQSGQACNFVITDDSLNTCLSQPVIACTPLTACYSFGNPVPNAYFQSGFDVTRTVLAYDRANSTLYLAFRVAGQVGDSDGDGTDGPGNCPNATITDPAGIGINASQQAESYVWTIFCGSTVIHAYSVTATDRNHVTVKDFGVPVGAGSGAYSVHDLEVKVVGVNLPPNYGFSYFVQSNASGLSANAGQTPQCAVTPQIRILKTANPSQLCPNGTTSIALTISNPGGVPLTGVVACDLLPSGLAYVPGSSGGTCAVGEPAVNGQQLCWALPQTLQPGATCVIAFQARRNGSACFGQVVNHSTVDGIASFCGPNGPVNQPVHSESDVTLVCSAACVAIRDTTTCQGTGTTLCANACAPSTSPIAHYSWSGPGGPFPDAPCIVIPASVTGSPGPLTYTVTVDGQDGCTASDNGTVTVLPGPGVAIRDTSTCPGTSTVLCAIQTGGAPIVHYLWTGPGGPFPDASCIVIPANAGSAGGIHSRPPSTHLAPSASVSTTASTLNYHVTVTDANGCAGTDDGTVTLLPNPVVSITPVAVQCVDGGPITLTSSPPGGTFSGPGVTGNQFDPAAAGVGTWTIHYSYVDPQTGCPGDASTKITVQVCQKLCVATTTIQADFNGTAIVGAPNKPAYVWFNSNFKICGGSVVAGTMVKLVSSHVSINGQLYDVPDATITFQAVSCASTSFDPITKSWQTTVPLAGSDEIFLSGLALPLVSLAAGAKVSWSGTIETSTPGLCVCWKWGAAAYSSFTVLNNDPFSVDYNGANIKPTHTNACGISNSDHAGTPENAAIKGAVKGGARGGGGSNWTGSWSGTANVCLPCPPSPPAIYAAIGSPPPQETTGPGESVLDLTPYPNPFQESTHLWYVVGGRAQQVGIGVFDVAGRRLRSLVRGTLAPGRYEASWDGTDDRGDRMAKGIYLLHIAIGEQLVTRRVLYLH